MSYTPYTGNSPKYLVVGSKGWIGGMLADMLESQGKNVTRSLVRIEDRSGLLAEIDKVKPTHILNTAGVTGRPNVDWCESNKQATIRSNVIGTLNLIDIAFLNNIHITNFATGCIYQYDDAHPMGSGKGFKEEDEANFDGSYYSKTKAMVEEIAGEYPNLLNLRLRMPVSDELHPRNFVTKISKYERVVDIPNSNTLLFDLLPASILMSTANLVGVYNFTNPGAISHNEVLTLFKKYVRPEFEWKNFTLEEQSKVIKAGRSNCELDTTKLVKALNELGVDVPEVHVAYENCFKRMAKGEGLKSKDQF
ncbi:NAD(P)-binding protein [Meredithblackwellia eburnea MCA 4105]